MSLTKNRASIFTLMLCALVGVFMSLALAPAAFAASATSPDYSISTYSTGNLDQHVVVSVDYGEAVEVANANAATANMTITIAGRDITSDAYHRPVTATADGTKLRLDIGNVMTQNESSDWTVPAFTAQYSGVINLSGVPSGVTVNGAATTTSLSLNTIIPTGVAIATTGEGTDSVIATMSHLANVRGMVHIGCYYKDSSTGKLVPAFSSAGNINCYTGTIHAHAFTTMVASDYLSAIAGLDDDLADGFSLEAVTDGGGNVTGVTFSSLDQNAQLYMYIFDANSLSDLNTDYLSIVNRGTGELDPDGNETD